MNLKNIILSERTKIQILHTVRTHTHTHTHIYMYMKFLKRQNQGDIKRATVAWACGREDVGRAGKEIKGHEKTF